MVFLLTNKLNKVSNFLARKIIFYSAKHTQPIVQIYSILYIKNYTYKIFFNKKNTINIFFDF